jgi:hypothetical protein
MRGGVEYSAPEVINCEALTTAAGRRQNRSKNSLNFLFLTEFKNIIFQVLIIFSSL